MSNVIHNQGHRSHVLSRRGQVIRLCSAQKNIRQQIVSHYSSSHGAGNKRGGKAINKSIATLRAIFLQTKIKLSWSEEEIKTARKFAQKSKYHFQSSWLTPGVVEGANRKKIQCARRLLMNCTAFGSVSLMSLQHTSSPLHFIQFNIRCCCFRARRVFISFLPFQYYLWMFTFNSIIPSHFSCRNFFSFFHFIS